MAIPYSILPITTNPRDKKAKRKLYARAQRTHTLTTRDIAVHLARHNSPFSVGTIVGLLEDAHKCILEHLQEGARVNLGALGAFYTTLTSRGADSAEEFTEDNITRVNLRWRPSKEMEQGMEEVDFEFVPTRVMQRRAKKEHQQNLNEEVRQSKK